MGRARVRRRRRGAPGEEALIEGVEAHARARLKAGASDAEVRIELLDRGCAPSEIDAVMQRVTPRRSWSLPLVFSGLAVSALAACVFLYQSSLAMQSGASPSWRLATAVALVGAALVARGLTPRG